jgi:hypothetical protein
MHAFQSGAFLPSRLCGAPTPSRKRGLPPYFRPSHDLWLLFPLRHRRRIVLEPPMAVFSGALTVPAAAPNPSVTPQCGLGCPDTFSRLPLPSRVTALSRRVIPTQASRVSRTFVNGSLCRRNLAASRHRHRTFKRLEPHSQFSPILPPVPRNAPLALVSSLHPPVRCGVEPARRKLSGTEDYGFLGLGRTLTRSALSSWFGPLMMKSLATTVA